VRYNVDGKGGKIGASLYTRLVSFARIEPMLNPILTQRIHLSPFHQKRKEKPNKSTPQGDKIDIFIVHSLVSFFI